MLELRLTCTCFFRSDPEYLDSYIKGELMRRVSEAFPEEFANNDISRNLYRDRIIECVKLNYQVCFVLC